MALTSGWTRVFVYGTLKKGFPNHYLLADNTGKYGEAKFIGEGTTVDQYPMVIIGKYNIPGLLAEKGTGEVSTSQPYKLCP